MKKPSYILLFVCFLTINLVQAQEEKKESKLNIIAYGGIGYAIVENDDEPNYNLNSNSGYLLLNYRITQKFGVATGVGLNELSGNAFNSNGNFYQERTMIKIPLLATMDHAISDKLKMIGNFGFYTQTITNDEYRFLDTTQKDVYEGWNFGTQFGLGFVFKISDSFSTGINYSGQSDFSKFKTNDNQGIDDKQKIRGLNSIGVTFMVDL